MYPHSRYVDPKVDFAFKRVFGDHKNLLISFLNAMLPLSDDALITDLEYLTPEQVPEVPALFKNSIVDVKCVDALKRTFIVEMQMLWTASFAQRILFSASQAYVKQLGRARDYAKLGQVYALAITNSIFAKDDEAFYHHYRIVRTAPPERVLTGLEFVFIELPKFKPKTRTDRLMQAKWLQFLSEVGKDDAEWDAAPEPERVWRDDADIAQALRLVETAAYTAAELDAYHRSQDRMRIEPTIMADMKAEGRAEGLVEGERKAQIKTLHRLLTKRFGELDPSASARIDAASSDQLDAWLDCGIDAPDIDTVLSLR
jgi:predicted transposase/invertase (TIGR01784 family)